MVEFKLVDAIPETEEVLLETMRLTGGQLPLGRLHLDRLGRGLNLLSVGLTATWQTEALAVMQEFCKALPEPSGKLRMLARYLAPNQVEIALEYDPLPPPHSGLKLGSYPSPILPSTQQVAKWAGTPYYYEVRQAAQQMGWEDVLLYDIQQALAETGIGNLFFLIENTWYTPPLATGCLQGVFREYLLKAGLIQVCAERDTDLARIQALSRGNALRGLEPIQQMVDLDGRTHTFPTDSARIFGEQANHVFTAESAYSIRLVPTP